MNAWLQIKNLLTISTIVCVLLLSCARERARTDIALEMTDEDSVEAIIDQDLLTAGGTIVNIEESPDRHSAASTVTYVDEVKMQKPVVVEPDVSLKPAPGTAEESTEPGLIKLDDSLTVTAEKKPEAVTPDDETYSSDEEPPDVIFTEEPIVSQTEMISEEIYTDKDTAEVTSPSEALYADVTDTSIVTEVQETVVEEISIPGEEPVTEEISIPGEEPVIEVAKIDDGIQPAVLRPPGGSYYSTYSKAKKTFVYPRHKVARGDTLWSVSKKYGCTISELVAANGITRRSILQIGQILIIPVEKKEPEVVESKPEAETEIDEEVSLTTTDIDQPASTLETPSTTEEAAVAPSSIDTEYYTVKSGDSYWKIAREYGITSSELMALNDTTDSLIRIGQKILVPRK